MYLYVKCMYFAILLVDVGVDGNSKVYFIFLYVITYNYLQTNVGR